MITRSSGSIGLRFKDASRLFVFVLLFTLMAPATAQCAESLAYGVFHGTLYGQSDGTLKPWATGPVAFEAWVRGRASSTVTRTTLNTPAGSQMGMAEQGDGASIAIAFMNTTMRNALFPIGTYTVVERMTVGASRTNTLVLIDGPSPPAATFLDTAAWATWPARKDLPVHWEPGVGSQPNDSFVVSVQDMLGVQKLFESPGPGQPGALAGNATSFTIPAASLTNHGTFFLKIACYRAQSGAPQLSGHFSATLARISLVDEATEPVSRLHLLTGRVFGQEPGQTPVLLTAQAYKVEAYLVERNANQISNVTLTAEGRTPVIIPPGDSPSEWTRVESFASVAALDAAWPAGMYRWDVLQALGGLQTDFQPLAPPSDVQPLQVLDLDLLATQTLDRDIELSWAPTGPTSTNDRIELIVTSLTGELLARQPDPRLEPPLPGDATHLTLNVNNLPQGVPCLAALRYIRVVHQSTNTFHGADAVSGHFAETRFSIGRTAANGPLPPAIFSNPLPQAIVAETYDVQLASYGGVRPHRWVLAAGALPPGLSLTTEGFLSGVPTLAGEYPFTAQLTDASNQVAQASWTLVATGTIPPLYIATTNLPAAHGSWPYLIELASGGGLPPVRWELASGQLPPGISLTEKHGILSGVPLEQGDYAFAVRLVDSAGATAQRSLSLSVSGAVEPALAVSGYGLAPDGRLALGLTASGGDPVSIEFSTDCVHWTTHTAVDYPGSDGIRLATPERGTGFYRARWGRAPTAANPAAPVAPQTDSTLSVTGTSDPTTSLSLALTNNAGHIYRLDVPTNAAPYNVDIRMTFVPSLGVPPLPGTYHGGVELRPAGLRFRQPATLTVTFSDGVPPGYTPLAWEAGGSNPHLAVARAFGNAVVIPVMHFSGLGGADASSGDTRNYSNENPACPQYAGAQSVAAAIKDSAAKGDGSSFDAMDLIPAFKVWFDTTVWPGLKTGQSDIASFEYAVSEYLAWKRAYELCGMTEAAQSLGNVPSGSFSAEQRILLSLAQAIVSKVPPVLARGYANAVVQTHIRAVSEMDPWVAKDMVGYVRSAQLLGVDAHLPDYLTFPAVMQRLARVWRFEMKLQSIIDSVAESGQFVEQVRSDKCPIELNPASNEGNLLMLEIGSTTNIYMVSWDHQRGDGVRVRAVAHEGQLKTIFLKVDPVYPEASAGGSSGSDCSSGQQAKYPTDAKIQLLFNVTDPVTSTEKQTEDGDWKPSPGDGSLWENGMKLVHATATSDFPFIPNAQWPNLPAPTDIFIAKPSVWTYSGGTVFADVTKTFQSASARGIVKQNIIVELYFAPKPLRDSDTKLPPPAGRTASHRPAP